MTPARFLAILARIGKPAYKGLARVHNVGSNQPNRWASGDAPIPEPVADWWEALDAWITEHPPPRAW